MDEKENKKDGLAGKINPLSFGKKVAGHWPIIAIAVIFDLLALIPFVSIIFNFIFGGILFFYFTILKKSPAKSNVNFLRIVLPIGFGSAIDFMLGVLPVNTAATLFRIMAS
ncbi:MAG: hypothetical protein PHC85_03160 [Candidatus Pacebacteria bacterium]|nr:hypothetical protein [Candidatus Paceibacterota bacterium]